MEAQLDPHNPGQHSAVEGGGDQGEGEQHHHKSVLKKVKEKAKKIKNTMKKHGHIGHEHDNDDDDDDDETVNDHEVHGAPIYESTVVRSVNLPKESHTNLESHANLEKPTDTREDRYDDDDNPRNKGTNMPFAPGRPQTDPPELHSGINRNAGMPKSKIKHLTGLEEDPNSPENSPSENITPSNYQLKVAHPARSGSKEAEVAPLVSRFHNLNVGCESKTDQPEQRSYTGSHDQFSTQPTPTKTQFINPESTNLKNDQVPATMAVKISATTSAIADKALSAKNVVASKLGYGGGAAEAGNKPVSASATEYAHMVAEKLTPAYEKVAGAGNAVMSKVVVGGGGDAVGVPAKGGGSIGGYLAEKFRPGDEDKALSEAITGAFKGEGRPAAGKVTVSKEVADRLGPVEESKREGEDAVAAGLESSGQGLVDRLRDAVGVWLGKSNGMQTAQDSVSSSYVSGVGAGTGQDFSGRKKD